MQAVRRRAVRAVRLPVEPRIALPPRVRRAPARFSHGSFGMRRPGTLRIGSALGIPILVHVSWLIAAILVTMSLTALFRPFAPRAAPILAAATALVFFASIVAHELAHGAVAQRLGVPVVSITLFVFGRVAQIAREPKRPRDELLIAVAGPLASAAIGLACLAVSRSGLLPPFVAEPIAWVARINLGVAVFNLLPGFPLDGGRIARAVLWRMSGDPQRATVTASRIGQGIAYILIAMGGLSAIAGNIGNGIWIAFVGWFLLNAAASSVASATLRGVMQGVAAGQAMSLDYPSVPAEMTLASYIEQVAFVTGRRTHLVTHPYGIGGFVTLEQVTAVPRAAWTTTTVGSIEISIDAPPSVSPETPLVDVLEAMADARLVTVRRGARLVGVIEHDRLLAVLRAHLDVGAPTPGPGFQQLQSSVKHAA
jgi:Zn-dependent protease